MTGPVDAHDPRQRTVLAWHRTALSVVVGALVLLRLAAAGGVDHPAALTVIGLAAVMGVVVMVQSRRWTGAGGAGRGGRMALLLATSVTLLVSVELWVVLARG